MLSALYASHTSRRQRDELGFTLIELLIVVIIIGILAAIALPIFINQQKVAVDASVKSDVRNTVTDVVNWRVGNGAVAAADTAAYKAAGGKVAQSRASSYMSVATASDGTFTVCAYDAGSSKYTAASKAYSFNSATGSFSTLAGTCNGGTNTAGAGDPETTSTVLDYTSALVNNLAYKDAATYGDTKMLRLTTTTDYIVGYGSVILKDGTISGAKTAVTKGQYNLDITTTCSTGTAPSVYRSYPVTNIHYFDANGNDLNYVQGNYAYGYNAVNATLWCDVNAPAGRLKLDVTTYPSTTWYNANRDRSDKITFTVNGVTQTLRLGG